MLVLEFKTYGKTEQFKAIDEAIRICQFIRNKSIRLWMDGEAKSWFDLSKYCAIWAKEFDFANKLGAGCDLNLIKLKGDRKTILVELIPELTPTSRR